MPSHRKGPCQSQCYRGPSGLPSRCRRRHCVGSMEVPIGQSNSVLTHPPCMRPPLPPRRPSACPRRTNFNMQRCRKGPLPRPCHESMTFDRDPGRNLNCPAGTATDDDCFNYRYIQEDDSDDLQCGVRYFQGTQDAPCQTEPVRVVVREYTNREKGNFDDCGPPCPFSNAFSAPQPCVNAPPPFLNASLPCPNPPCDLLNDLPPCPYAPPPRPNAPPTYSNILPPCPNFPPPCFNASSGANALRPCPNDPFPNAPMTTDGVTCTNTVLLQPPDLPCPNPPPFLNVPPCPIQQRPAQVSVSVDCVPTINSLGTMCSHRNVSFNCELPLCPSNAQISRKCQASFENSGPTSCSCPSSVDSIGKKKGDPGMLPPCPKTNSQSCMMQNCPSNSVIGDPQLQRNVSGRPSCCGEAMPVAGKPQPKGKVHCQCKKSAKKQRKKEEKEKAKSKVTCKCNKKSSKKQKNKVNRRVMANGVICECQTSEGSGTSFQSKGYVPCACYDVGVSTSLLKTIEGQGTENQTKPSLVKKSLDKIKTIFDKKKSSDKIEKNQQKDSGNQRDIVTASLLQTAEIKTEGVCDCRYPPAFKKLYCSGHDTGTCSCKNDVSE